MEFALSDLDARQLYKLMIGTVVPRPIGWISSLAPDGTANLAPYSYFNAVGADPPTVMFSGGLREGLLKDTIRNVEASGEFVVNIVTEPLLAAMNHSAIDTPSGVSEFELAGLTAAPSLTVEAPRVVESLAHFECVVSTVLEVGANRVVFGRITHLHIADRVLLPNHKIDMERLRPVGRLAGTSYTLLGTLVDLVRPSFDPAGDNRLRRDHN